MATERRLVQSSNHITIQFDGQEVGLLQDIQANDQYGHELVSEVGSIHGVENVPTLAQHDLSTSQAILYKDNLRRLGIATENGDDALRGRVFDICIYGKDPLNAGLIRKYVNCSYLGGSVDIRKNAVLIANATFRALDVVGKGI